MAYLSADPFLGGHILSPSSVLLQPFNRYGATTSVALTIQRLPLDGHCGWFALTDAYRPNQTTGLCVYGIVDSFKDILVIIYSINYRI